MAKPAALVAASPSVSVSTVTCVSGMYYIKDICDEISDSVSILCYMSLSDQKSHFQ